MYVTGSNSKLLSKDVMTEFRGRGDVIHVYPLSFSEYYAAAGLDKYEYLESLFEEIYFKDIEERYNVLLPDVLRSLTSGICSSVGSLTNASKIARTVSTIKKLW